ncbi:hypothetical protein UFOVP903_48 [uncultured Caudovirales phage]|uniref:Uncharacterized protein n=1 Tax=uncultured Caudovirales phage TaxID=2100421 RepID=A0A6J5RQ28_9CAUD|nr:hypothetical protein UFOVP903_48 [uncultured Caudovirales phage]CAB4198132.1 hypothetical protein UFOVP1318_56 [uncultured Caudovirales phage]CAB4210801.1 hypothetical protein UFOVP1430_46 [uncultured Caudovirales phage]
MEFIKASLLNTSTQIAVNSNSTTASNLFNPDPAYQFSTSGLDNDLTTASMVITFDSPMSVSRIALVDMNFKEFRLFYNGSTANSFSPVGGDTTSSVYTGNADANKYFRFSTIQCSSITIEATKTFIVNQEKFLGLFIPSDLILELEKRPSAQSYKPSLNPKQVVHKLSDGGTRIHNVRKKWSTTLDLDYVSETERDTIYEDLYNFDDAFVFCPFGTATGWGGQIFETVWDGPFSFYEFSDNNANVGFSGKISLKETSS